MRFSITIKQFNKSSLLWHIRSLCLIRSNKYEFVMYVLHKCRTTNFASYLLHTGRCRRTVVGCYRFLGPHVAVSAAICRWTFLRVYRGCGMCVPGTSGTGCYRFFGSTALDCGAFPWVFEKNSFININNRYEFVTMTNLVEILVDCMRIRYFDTFGRKIG